MYPRYQCRRSQGPRLILLRGQYNRIDDEYVETDYACCYIKKGDATCYNSVCKLAAFFKENGVDLMSLSELARYEIASELVENNMNYAGEENTGFETGYGLSYSNVCRENLVNLVKFYTIEPISKYYSYGVCAEYAYLKRYFAEFLGLNVLNVYDVDTPLIKADELHAWVIAKLKNSTGKEMSIVDDYGILTGDSSDGTSVVSDYEEGMSAASCIFNRELSGGLISKIKRTGSNYPLSDYNDVIAIRTCGIFNTGILGFGVDLSGAKAPTRDTPPADGFYDEMAIFHTPDESDYLEMWQKYFDEWMSWRS